MESDFSRVKHASVSNTRNRNGFSQRRRDTLRMWGGNVTGQQLQPCVWALPPKPQKRVVHTFTWGVQREKQWSCPHNERVYSSQRSFVLCGNNYFADCGDKSILWPVLTKFWWQTISPTCGDRSGNVFAFLALTLQMGHTVQGRLRDYWTKIEQLCTLFYGLTMARARYFHTTLSAFHGQ